MSTFWSILKVGLPLLAQLIGVILSIRGGMNAGEAKSGEYTLSQQALPVYGNIGLGATLLAAGTSAQLLIGHHDKKIAVNTLPPAPIAGAVDDPVLHALAARQFEVATSPAMTDADLDTVNKFVKDWRAASKKPG